MAATTKPKTKVTRIEVLKHIKSIYGWPYDQQIIVTNSLPEKNAKELDDDSLLDFIDRCSKSTVPGTGWKGPAFLLWTCRHLGACFDELKYRTGIYPADMPAILNKHLDMCRRIDPEFIENASKRRVSFDRPWHTPMRIAYAKPLSLPKVPLSQCITMQRQVRPGLVWTRRKAPSWYRANENVIKELFDEHCKREGFEVID